ncbi:hypothetical protein [Streptomyces sp. NPDC059272]
MRARVRRSVQSVSGIAQHVAGDPDLGVAFADLGDVARRLTGLPVGSAA